MVHVEFVQVTKKKSGPKLRPNRLQGIHILKMHDGVWKIWDTKRTVKAGFAFLLIHSYLMFNYRTRKGSAGGPRPVSQDQKGGTKYLRRELESVSGCLRHRFRWARHYK